MRVELALSLAGHDKGITMSFCVKKEILSM